MSTRRELSSYGAGESGSMPWLPRFFAGLAAPDSRSFVRWAVATAAPHVVLDRSRFDAFDLRPWLGHLSILQWDSRAADYRYRLFGTQWAWAMRKDFTGQVLGGWPHKLAHAIRVRLDAVSDSGLPIGAHVNLARFDGTDVERGMSRYEQVLWPLRYGPQDGRAILLLAVRMPQDEADEHAGKPRSAGYWFGADGRKLGIAPAWPDWSSADSGDSRHDRPPSGARP